ncbi:gp53-like domain-containing protein [Sphingomonas trueperi]|uniref:gp53-like domain-containing protein n=1 Tax=Sphingomonas trueperi TaxID=53317 RepID=UPI000EB534F1
MSFTLTVTNAGRAAIVNAAKDGTNAVRIASVGVSATATTPSAATTTLPGEIKRITTIAGDAVAADTIHVTVRDESNALYAVRSIALYLSDGTLFAAYGQADVLVEKSPQAMLLLALDVRFADIAATSITFGNADFLNPPATTDTAGVAELATDAETSAGTDDRRTVTPKGLSFALSTRLASWGSDIWRASNDGAGSGLDADLLDGQQGSYYTNIPARLGYAPADRAGDRFTGNLAISHSRDLSLIYDAASTNLAYTRCSRFGRARWDIGMNSAEEIGGNFGSDFYINRFDDAGNFIDTPFLMSRGTGELRVQGGRAWHSNNDGAGSGLDADLLDGHDGAWYADILGHLGYTPLNRGGDTATGQVIFNANAAGNSGIAGGGAGEIEVRGNGVGAAMMAFHRPGSFATYVGIDTDNRLKVGGWSLGNVAYTIWHSGNDGSGSGLDADLLDGHDGAYYADIIGRLGFWPVRQGTGIGQLPNVVQIGWSGSRVKVTIDASDMGNVVFDNHIADVWRVSNDGAGSGLDADLLDGRQASEFALLNDGSRFGANEKGYWERRPNGVIEQWGTVYGPFSEGAVGIQFPVPFSDPNSVNVSAVGVNSSGNGRFDVFVQRIARDQFGATMMVQYTAASTSINQIDGFDWRAVGI